MKTSFFLLVGIIVTTASCKNNLTKSDAKAQIIVAGHYPIPKEYRFTKEYTKDQNTEGLGVDIILPDENFDKQKTMIDSFEKNKLVTFEEIPHREETPNFLGTTVRTWTTIKISLTQEGKKYLLKEDKDIYMVKLWDMDFDSIAYMDEVQQGGGGEELHKAISVGYTIINKNITPFGESFEDKNKKTQGGYSFSKYGNSWRIN